MNNITLGRQYKDRITGFVGMATATSRYITGLSYVELTGVVSAEGKKAESEWFDTQRVVDTGAEPFTLAAGDAA